MALSAVVAYFAVTEMGMNSAAANALTAAYTRGDLHQYRCLQGSATAFYISVALAFSLLFGLATALLPIPAWLGIRHIPATVAGWIAWLLAARILWQIPALQLGIIYRSVGNLAATQWFLNLQSLGLLMVTGTVLFVHGNVISLALWGTSPLVLVTAGAWFRLRQSHPELLPRLSDATIGGLRELLKPSLQFGLIMFSVSLLLQGPVLLVSRTLGGTAVALLVTTRTLANAVRQTAEPVQLALWPELTRLDALGAESALRTGHRLLVVGSVALSTAFASAVWFEGASVMAIWTRGKLAPDLWLLRIFLVAVVLQAVWLPSALFMKASNQHRRLAYSYFISAVIALTAIFLLVRSCGLLAVPLGVILGEAIACYHFVIKGACKLLKQDYVPFVLRLWSGVAVISFAAWGAGYLGHVVASGPAPLRWIEIGAMTTLASLAAAWSLALRKDERTLLAIWSKSRWLALRPLGADVPA
jgi:O-antigen/teichoic acid export membrane protein